MASNHSPYVHVTQMLNNKETTLHIFQRRDGEIVTCIFCRWYSASPLKIIAKKWGKTVTLNWIHELPVIPSNKHGFMPSSKWNHDCTWVCSTIQRKKAWNRFLLSELDFDLDVNCMMCAEPTKGSLICILFSSSFKILLLIHNSCLVPLFMFKLQLGEKRELRN